MPVPAADDVAAIAKRMREIGVRDGFGKSPLALVEELDELVKSHVNLGLTTLLATKLKEKLDEIRAALR